jgi:hypothetical protein
LLLRVAVRVAWGSHTERRQEEVVVFGHLLAHQVVVVVQKLHYL